MKYLLLEKDYLKSAVLFSDTFRHNEEAKRHPEFTVISAGFVSTSGEQIYVYGGSTSLQMKSKEEDAEIITKEMRRGE